MVAEVLVDHGAITIDRIVAAVDCGVAINPDIVTAQIEGAIGFALSAALRNQVTLNKGVVEQSNFDNYEPTRIREMPKPAEPEPNRQIWTHGILGRAGNFG